MVTSYFYRFSICIAYSTVIGIASLSYAKDTYKIIYDSPDDILELVEHTFLTHLSAPKEAQLLKPKELARVNDIIFKFVEKKNKTLGIKNSDIDDIAKQFRALLKELTQQTAIIEGSSTSLTLLRTNAPSIILKLQAIYDQCETLQTKIKSLISKRFSLLGAQGKDLLKMLHNALEDIKNFDEKVEKMIRNKFE